MGSTQWGKLWPDSSEKQPLPWDLNPGCDEIRKPLREWAVATRMLADDIEATHRHCDDYALYTSFCHPSASVDGLLLAAKWMVFLYLFDNHIDEQRPSDIPPETFAMLRDIGRIITVDTVGHADPVVWRSPYARTLSELWDESRRFFRNSAWERLFVDLFSDYRDGQLWELSIRKSHRSWDFTTYTECKRAGTASVIGASFVVAFCGRYLPSELLNSYAFRLITNMACDTLHLAADVMSADHEEKFEGIPNVLTTVRCLDSSLDQDEAFRIFFTYLWRPRLRSFLQASEDFPIWLQSLGQDTPQNLDSFREYVEWLLLWSGGIMEWISRAARYR